MCTVFWGTTWLVFCPGCAVKRCCFSSVLSQVGFLGRRNRIWNARYLSGMHTCERKEEASLGKRKSSNAGSAKSGSTPKRTLELILPIRVTFIKPRLLGLPYLLASLCLWHGLLQEWCVSWPGLCLQLSPTLEEVTAKHQVLSRSGWHIPMSSKGAVLLKRSSK